MGSFFTLATYRIPLKQDIIHTRSYCPKCKSELQFKDLLPILSYIFLKGKCRYCNNKISPRYIIIEFFSGLFYLLFIISLRIDFFSINIFNIIQILYGTLIISTWFILGQIAKETKETSRGTLIFGLIVQIIYITYLYILGINIYRYIIYIISLILIMLIQKLIKSKNKRKIIDLIIVMLLTILTTNEIIFIIVFCCMILILIVKNIFIKRNNINIVFYISFLNILFLIIYNFIISYTNLI